MIMPIMHIIMPVTHNDMPHLHIIMPIMHNDYAYYAYVYAYYA